MTEQELLAYGRAVADALRRGHVVKAWRLFWEAVRMERRAIARERAWRALEIAIAEQEARTKRPEEWN